MSQTLSVNDFKWVKDKSQFSKDLSENYNEDSNEGYFFEDDVQYPESLYDLHSDLAF